MASIIDSFRDTFGDKLAVLKLLVLTVPAYYSYTLYLQSQQGPNGFWFVASLTFLLLFGTMVKVTSNIINERCYILPALKSPHLIFYSALKAIVAIFPMVIIPYFIAKYLCSIINVIFWLDITLKTLIWLIFASIVVTAFLMYCVREKISDAYNIKLIYQKAGDLIVVLIFFVIQIAIMNIPTTIFLGYLLYVLFGYCPLLDFFIALSVVFNICATGHYLGQVHYETIVYSKTD